MRSFLQDRGHRDTDHTDLVGKKGFIAVKASPSVSHCNSLDFSYLSLNRLKKLSGPGAQP